jgi:hypothetical protein
MNVNDSECDANEEKENLKKDFFHYRQTLAYMGANVPLQVLCLPKEIENALLSNGCLRVYDLIDRDLRKIKGIGDRRLELLTTRLDEFFTVSI